LQQAIGAATIPSDGGPGDDIQPQPHGRVQIILTVTRFDLQVQFHLAMRDSDRII
jgi:hypothetical protein